MGRNITVHSRNQNTRDPNNVLQVNEKLQEIYNQFKENVNDIKKQFGTASFLANEGKEEEAKDIYRSQIVFLESSLDYYIHSLSIYAMREMYKGNWDKTDSYRNLKIPIEKVMTAIAYPENSNWIEEAIISHHATKTYMSSSEIKSQLTLIRDKSLLKNIADEMYYIQGSDENTEKKLKRLLDDLFKRRNMIAPQTDREHYSGQKNDINKDEVNYFISEISKFVDTLNRILNDE